MPNQYIITKLSYQTHVIRYCISKMLQIELYLEMIYFSYFKTEFLWLSSVVIYNSNCWICNIVDTMLWAINNKRKKNWQD